MQRNPNPGLFAARPRTAQGHDSMRRAPQICTRNTARTNLTQADEQLRRVAQRLIEAYLLDFSRDLHGVSIEISFHTYLRPSDASKISTSSSIRSFAMLPTCGQACRNSNSSESASLHPRRRNSRAAERSRARSRQRPGRHWDTGASHLSAVALTGWLTISCGAGSLFAAPSSLLHSSMKLPQVRLPRR